jgi:general secretion pathway protein G
MIWPLLFRHCHPAPRPIECTLSKSNAKGMALTRSFGKIRSDLKRGQRGFTMIELLIVVAIIGVLGGVIIPNVGGFVKTGTLNAANMELENVKTASFGYLGDNGAWPADTSVITAYLAGIPKATYGFDGATGYVISVSDVTWSGLAWSAPPGPSYTRHGEWTK